MVLFCWIQQESECPLGKQLYYLARIGDNKQVATIWVGNMDLASWLLCMFFVLGLFLFGLVWLFFGLGFFVFVFVFLLPPVYLPFPNDALIVNPDCYTHYPIHPPIFKPLIMPRLGQHVSGWLTCPQPINILQEPKPHTGFSFSPSDDLCLLNLQLYVYVFFHKV